NDMLDIFKSHSNSIKLSFMTTDIVIRCKDAVILASDSQGTGKSGLRRLDAQKIIPIKKSQDQKLVRYAMAGSGHGHHVKKLAELIGQSIGDKILDDQELQQAVDAVLLESHRKYNVDRAKAMGLTETKTLFRPIALLGAQ